MVDSVITWGYINEDYAVSVVLKPNIGGIFFDETITNNEKWVLIPYDGTDPYCTINVCIYSMYKKTWIIDYVNK